MLSKYQVGKTTEKIERVKSIEKTSILIDEIFERLDCLKNECLFGEEENEAIAEFEEVLTDFQNREFSESKQLSKEILNIK